jgi:deoxyribonuclease-4
LNPVGIHIRLTNTINDVINKAIKLELPLFQTFAVNDQGHVIKLTQADIDNYLELRRTNFKELYLHSSYWVNLSRENHRSYRTFLRELDLAQKLEFTHYILHPGAAESKAKKEAGILVLAKNLNQVLNQDSQIQILLENTAHGGRSIGSNLEDFKILLNEIKHPEKLNFCIDTSHAYAYGYDLASQAGLAEFIKILEQTITLEKIKLIHLNDTTENLGAKIDKHELPGHGKIGQELLAKFVKNKLLAHVPIIMELPKLEESIELEIIKQVKSW